MENRGCEERHKKPLFCHEPSSGAMSWWALLVVIAKSGDDVPEIPDIPRNR